MQQVAKKSSSRKPGFRQILFSEPRRALGEPRLSTYVVLYPRVPYHDGLDVSLLYIFGLATTGAYLS
jgi:hypothetical protein